MSRTISRYRLTSFAVILTASLVACSTTSTTSSPQAQSGPPPPPPLMAPPADIAVAAASAPEPVLDQLAEGDLQRTREQAYPASKSKIAGNAQMRFAPAPVFMPAPAPEDRETYAHLDDNPIHRAAEQPVSTFSIDVDTGSYSNMRRFLNEGRLPPADAVRVEEFINYFDYADAPAAERSAPFAVATELATTPWNGKTKLLRIGIKGWQPTGPLPPSNLVFLVDVSGSMDEANKLPLVKSSLKLLARQLRREDRISLVTYAGATEVVLEPTPGDQHAAIEQAIDRLGAGGSTAGAAGITLAYQQAEKAFLKPGNNRVLLATDGDFNVGITRFESLLDMVKDKRKSGVALTTLGFGTGNYNDRLMEQLADAGDGNYAYIDSLQEAAKALVAQRAATLLTIARDVKIQVEFNPALVAEYRLIGYENRALKREDFNNDQIDAGEIGAGHTVTALYEVALAGSGGERNEALRYGGATQPVTKGEELAFVRLRYKRPGEQQSRLIEKPVRLAEARSSLAQASGSLRLAAAVAAFGQKLKGGAYLEGMDYPAIARLAQSARAADASGSVGEFERLVQLAAVLSTGSAVPTPSE